MSTLFRVVDLTKPEQELDTQSPLQAGKLGVVDLNEMRSQLIEIRNALSPVLEEEAQKEEAAQKEGVQRKPVRLKSIELDLTVGLEGQVWFVAKGKGEASLKLIWDRSG